MDAARLRPVRARLQSVPGLHWLLLIWLAIMVSFAQFRLRDASELFSRAGLDFQVKLQIAVWFVLGLLALRLVLARRIDLRLLRRGPLFWYAAYCVWAIVSSLWSVSPLLSAFRAGQLAVAILLVLSLRPRPFEVYAFVIAFLGLNWILVLLGTFGWNLGQSWIVTPGAAYMMHGEAPENPWRLCSAFGHPSQIGVVAAAAAAGLLARTTGRRWWIHGPLIAFFALTATLTVSRTCIAGMAMGMLVVLLMRRDLWPAAFALVTISLPLLLIPQFNEGVVRFLLRGQSQSEFRSMTGRDQIYAAALERIERGGFLGLGYEASRTQVIGATTAHAHNAFLESFASLGLPGLVLAVITVASLLRSIAILLHRSRSGLCADRFAGWEAAGMTAPMLLFCLTDSGFAVHPNACVMLFLVIIVQTTSLCAATSAQASPVPRPTGSPSPELPATAGESEGST